jgi:hypothetical protein
VCPGCGTETLFSRAEALENEDEQMKELSKRLAVIKKDDGPVRLKEAKVIITKLRQMNLRWNISQLDDFLKQRQRDLFF